MINDQPMSELGRFTEPSLYILVSLSAGPKHGYAIMTDVEEISGERLGPGTLYAALARLEARGLIEALPPEERRRPYRLTGLGATWVELAGAHQIRLPGADAGLPGLIGRLRRT
jgi:DNA-binding PadR family transcriptional regulator